MAIGWLSLENEAAPRMEGRRGTEMQTQSCNSISRARASGDEVSGGQKQGSVLIERRTKKETKTRRPPLYKVILLNDDYTPMEFVVDILKTVFHKPHAEATRIMLHVHQNGMGVAGIYPFEIAETRVKTVDELSRQYQYPLKCVMEKE
jgi:ATP-dependent Clp protease adaptor protein ClpS